MKTVVEYDLLDETQEEAHKRIDRVLWDGAVETQGKGQSIAPVQTGRYRASISVRKVGNLLYEVFSIVEYGPFLEWGTIYMSAQLVFRPSYDRNYQQIIANLEHALSTL